MDRSSLFCSVKRFFHKVFSMTVQSIQKRFSRIFPLVLVLALTSKAEAQRESIKWISWESAQDLVKKEPKKLIVDLYTDWCGWCKRMDASTFQDPRIVRYVNQNFYAIKFNAEQTQDIIFKNKSYKFIPRGTRGYHELAVEIANGQLSYPTVVFIDEDLNTLQPIPGYWDADDFEMISNYFGGNFYKTTPWSTFQEKFKSSNKK